MTQKNIRTILFPSIAIIVITLFATLSLDKFVKLDYKGILVISIVLFFPLLILIQGVIIAINRTNIFLSLGLSLLTTIIVGMAFSLNDTSIGYATISFYVIRYLKYGVVGYLISYIVIKIRSKIRKHNSIKKLKWTE